MRLKLTKYIVAIFLFFTGNIISQTSINIKEIKKLFKSKKEMSWYTCNNDSTYFKNDTIKLIKSRYSPYKLDCCSVVSWNFINKYEFTFKINRPCREPTSYTVFFPNKGFKIIRKKDNVFLKIYTNYELEEQFKVIDFEQSLNLKTDDRISLLRLK